MNATQPSESAPSTAPAPDPASAPPRHGLTRGTRRLALAIAVAGMPGEGDLPAPGEAMVDRLDAFLGQAPRLLVFGYRMLLRATNLAAIVFTGRTLARLPVARAERLLAGWAASRWFLVRMALRGLFTPLKMCHFADAEVSRRLGYDPPPPAPPAPPERWMAQASPAADRAGETLRCQVVIVGSGPGGAVMATRLAEQGLAVLMLEEGQLYRRADFNRRPLEMMTRMYRDVGMTVALGVPGIPIPLGRTVGGTSTINSGTCFRVPERVLEQWRDRYGLEAYTSESLAPHYDELERTLRVQPVSVETRGMVGEVIARGCDRLGWSHGPLMRNADGCEGSGVCCFGCPTGAKQSMNRSYVPRALGAGAKLLTGAKVERILWKQRRAQGVVATTDQGKVTVLADAVVISAGSLGTPPLLMRNRIGGRSGQLGNNLTIHPAAKVAALFDEPIRSWEGVPQGWCIDQFEAEGMMFEGASLPPELGAVGLPQIGRAFSDIMNRYQNLAFFGFLVEDESRGRVRPGPGGMPRIHYSLGREEVAKLLTGTERLCRVFFEAGATKVLPPVAGVEALTSPDEIEKLRDPRISVGDFELTAFHPLCTARMSARPEDGVIDPGLEVWGVDGLFVADGSVFPSSLGVNPQMTIMAVTSMNAEHVAARVGGAPRWGQG